MTASRRRAVVTGASGGIGGATAVALARAGMAVWLTYTSDEGPARRIASELEREGAEVRVSRLDLRSPESIEALVSEVGDAWGELHVLVNNGGTCPYVAYTDIEVADWDEVMETNARGTFLLSRAALPLLRAAEGDRVIVNLSSIAGEVGAIATGMHYAASKAAILALTRSFARHLAAEGIRVNAVAPGPVSSKITDRLDEDARAGLERGVPLGRFGSPEEVAWVIASLASPAASFVTGATYDVNGGVRMD